NSLSMTRSNEAPFIVSVNAPPDVLDAFAWQTSLELEQPLPVRPARISPEDALGFLTPVTNATNAPHRLVWPVFVPPPPPARSSSATYEARCAPMMHAIRLGLFAGLLVGGQVLGQVVNTTSINSVAGAGNDSEQMGDILQIVGAAPTNTPKAVSATNVAAEMPAPSKIGDWDGQLKIGQYHRRCGRFDDANASFVGILTHNAPAAIQHQAL